MDPLKFIFELVDQMSGPSKTITKELKAVDDAIRKTDVSLKRSLIDKMTPGLQKQRAELGLQRDALMASAAQAEVFADKLSGARDVVNTIGKVGLAAGAAVAGIGYEMAKSAVDVASFAEDNKIALEVFTGSGEAANRILKNMIGLAAHLPINDMEAMAAATRLMTAGFQEKDLANLVTTMAAVQGFGRGKQGMTSFVNQMLEIKAAGVSDRHLRYLSQETGISETAIANSLRTVGKHGEYGNIRTVEDMKKAVSAGGVNGDDFVQAVVRAVGQMTGGDLSNLPGKLSKTLTGLMSTLEGRKFALMIDLDTSPGYASLRGFLSNLVAATDPNSETGKAISGNIASAFNDVFGKVFQDYAGPDGAQKIGDKIRNDVIPAFKDFATVVGGILGTTMTIVEGWAGLIRMMRGGAVQGMTIEQLTSGDLNTVNTSSTSALTGAAQARASRTGNLGWWDTFIGKLGVGQGNDYLHGGTDLAKGLANGMNAGQPIVAAAAADLAQTAIDAHKEVTQTHSPSRVFEQLGAFTAEGYAIGVRAGMPDARDAVSMLGAAPRASIPSSGGGRAPIQVQITVPVDARGATAEDSHAIAQAVEDALPTAVVRVFDMLSEQFANP